MGMNIKCYDNGGATFDRYTVVYLDQPERTPGLYAAVGASEDPFNALGLGQHTTAMPGDHLGREVPFDTLPAPVQQLVRQDFTD